jgi:hypothetical protein
MGSMVAVGVGTGVLSHATTSAATAMRATKGTGFDILLFICIHLDIGHKVVYSVEEKVTTDDTDFTDGEANATTDDTDFTDVFRPVKSVSSVVDALHQSHVGVRRCRGKPP